MEKMRLNLFLLLFLTAFGSFAQNDRDLWVTELVKMADPVLTALSKDELKEKMPTEQSSMEYGDRSKFAALEAFGRLLDGMAPWLELGPDDTPEGRLRKKYIELAVKATANAVDPAAKDFLNFTEGPQPLVDAAFLAQAFLRAPKQLWGNLPRETQDKLAEALRSTRTISNIPYNNWLLFAATIEAFLVKFAGDGDFVRMEYAMNKHMEWYVGDGQYADGEFYHADYYNSFVINPMLIDVVKVLKASGHRLGKLEEKIVSRAQRYSAIQERMISPEGTYPVVGRSSVYRFGSFQALAQMALLQELPDEISNAQVRAGLTAVLKRIFGAPGLYDNKGWLQIGVIGHQPDMGEPYINTGSLYLTSLGFLPLGLPADHPFWTDPAEKWSNARIWGGENDVKRDNYRN